MLDTSRSMLASLVERRADPVRAGAGRRARAPGRASRHPGRHRVAHRPRSPAPLSDGRSARVRRDDARGRRHRATTAVDVVRDQRDDARRARRRTDAELLHTRGEAPGARRLHGRREPAGDERALDRLRAARRASTSRSFASETEMSGSTSPESPRRDTRPIRPRRRCSRAPRRSRAGASSRRDRSARWPPACARRSPRAQPSTGASRGTARRSCRTSPCWRSSRSDSCSTVAISESG